MNTADPVSTGLKEKGLAARVRAFALGLPLVLGFAAPLDAAPGDQRPNILVIMTDDQGVGDVGYNNPLARTPVIDRLASESAVFTHFIAAPACMPSRAAFLTGRNHLRTGVWGVGPRGLISDDEVFLPDYLRRVGYRTAHFGKWEGWTPDRRPYLRGYDEAGSLGGGYQHRDANFDFNGELRTMEGWTSDVLADLTIDFIERRHASGEGPWFAVTAYIAPHGPWTSAPEFSEPLEAEGYSRPLATFYGMIHQMDTATGRILDALDRLGLRESTIVIFISDNGPTPMDPNTGGTPEGGEDWEKRNPHNLRGRKSYVWENGIRVPFTLRWPGRVPAGERPQLGAIEDILPTLLDLAGAADLPAAGEGLPLDGRSLRAVLENPETEPEERHYLRLPIAGEGMPLRADRDHIGIIEDPAQIDYVDLHAVLYGPRFKYHHRPGGAHELYATTGSDSAERENIAALHPGETRRLAELCRAEWVRLIDGERRVFTMPYVRIGDPRLAGLARGWGRHAPPDTILGDTPLAVGGTVRSPYGMNGAQGFVAAGDRATYGVDVITPATYTITVAGRGLDACAPLRLRIGDQELSPRSVAADRIEFGTVEMGPGRHRLDFFVGPVPDGEDTYRPALIREVAFRRP